MSMGTHPLFGVTGVPTLQLCGQQTNLHSTNLPNGYIYTYGKNVKGSTALTDWPLLYRHLPCQVPHSHAAGHQDEHNQIQ